MKITLMIAVFSATATAVTVQAIQVPQPVIRQTTATATARELQNENYNNYGSGGENDWCYMYENFEECLKNQMVTKSFTFTGCSSTATNSGGQNNGQNNNGQYAQYSQYNGNGGGTVYATFRLCDSCHYGTTHGCGNGNGDYVVSMEDFAEAFGEYWSEVTGNDDKDMSPFRCTRADEYKENYYNNQYNGNYNNNNNNGQNQNNGGQNNQNNQEWYVGPVCNGDGTTLKMGVFYDESCSVPAKGTSLRQVLGFIPSNTKMMAPHCLSCGMVNYNNNNNNNNNNNGGQQPELNPLCDRMLEESGRCDRTKDKETDFDAFWHDVVEWFSNDGYGNENENQNQDENNDNQNQNNYQNANQQQQNYYYNNNNGNYNNYYNYKYGNQNNYYQYQNENTCNLIDTLPHTQGVMFKSQGAPTGRLIGIIVAAFVACAILFGFARYYMNKRNERNSRREGLLEKKRNGGVEIDDGVPA